MKTQNQALLEYLQAGNSITSKEAYDKLGVTQLGRCLDDLEKEGHRFSRKWIEVPTRHGSGTTRVKEYRLIPANPTQGTMFPETPKSRAYSL